MLSPRAGVHNRKLDPGNTEVVLPRNLAIFICLLSLVFIQASCATRKDVVTTRSDLAAVRGNLEGLGSSLEKRQVVMSEELQEIKRVIGTLKARDEDFRQVFKQLQQRMKVNKIETDENLRHLTELNQEYQVTLQGNLQNIADRIKEMDKLLQDLRKRTEEINSLGNNQKRRLDETVNSLDVFLEEVNGENDRLRKSIVDLGNNYNQLVDKINAQNKKLADRINTIDAQFSKRIDKLGDSMDSLQESLKKRTESAAFHVVSEGDTLSSIAAKYNISVDQLARINGLSDPNNISVGQKIYLAPR